MAIITGTAEGEILTGTGAADEISGLEGEDYLRALGGADTLYGGDDNDLLNGGFGDDQFFGGNGIDRVSFFDLTGTITSGCHATLSTPGIAQDTGLGIDTLGSDIENLSGTWLDDHLTGNGGDNWIWAQNFARDGTLVANNDRLAGLGGDDCLETGTGDNIIIGGTGVDTAAIRFTFGGVIVDLALQGSAQDTTQGMMTLKTIENLSGSDFNDTFKGDGNDNTLCGAGADDVLVGNHGNDSLYGDGWISIDYGEAGYSGPIKLFQADARTMGGDPAEGKDTLDAGNGNDLLLGAGDADTLSGGRGADVFVYLEPNDSKPAGSEDTITDLKNIDRIDLSALDANTSSGTDDAFILVAALSGAAGEVSLRYDTGLHMTVLELENNGDSIVDMRVFILGHHAGFTNFDL